MATVQKGGAGHFVCADRCKFKRHTHIDGRYCVSTVGDLHYTEGGPTEEVGLDRTYETMVFDMKRRTRRWMEIDFHPYNDADEAEAGHRRVVRRWERRARSS